MGCPYCDTTIPILTPEVFVSNTKGREILVAVKLVLYLLLPLIYGKLVVSPKAIRDYLFVNN